MALSEYDLVQNLTMIDACIKNGNGEYRSFIDVISEIKSKWNSLTENEQKWLCGLLTASITA